MDKDFNIGINFKATENITGTMNRIMKFLNNMEKTSSDFGQSIKKANEQLGNTGRKAQQQANATKNLTQQANNYFKKLASANSSYTALNKSASKHGEEVKKMTSSMDKYVSKAKEAAKELSKSSGQTGKASGGLASGLKGAIGALAGVASGGAMSGLIGGLLGTEQAAGSAGTAIMGVANKVKMLIATAIGIRFVKEAFTDLIQKTDSYINTAARISNINDGLMTNSALIANIGDRAERSRQSFKEFTDTAIAFGNNASHVFANTQELLDFTETLNKVYVTSGTVASGVAAANLQISQALGMGVLRGQELNAVLEHAPAIARMIEKELDAPIGSIKQLGEQGIITADVLKNALLNNAEDINATIGNFPITFEHAKEQILRHADEGMGGIKAKIATFLGSDTGQQIMSGIKRVIDFALMGLNLVVTMLITTAEFVVAHWDVVKRVLTVVAIIAGVVLVGAVIGLAAAFLMLQAITLPITLGLVLAVAGIAMVINLVINRTIAMGITWQVVIQNIAVNLSKFIAFFQNGYASMWNTAVDFLEMLGNGFQDTIYKIINKIWELADAMVSMAEAGLSAVQEMVDGWVSKVNAGANAIIGAVNKIREGLGKDPISISANLSAPTLGGGAISSARGFLGRIKPSAPERIDLGGHKKHVLTGEEIESRGLDWANKLIDKIEGASESLDKFGSDYLDQFGSAGLDKYGIKPEGLADEGGAGGGSGSGKSPSLGRALKDIAKANKGTEENTKAIKDGLQITNENLAYLKDAAMHRALQYLKLGDININIDNSFGDINSPEDHRDLVREFNQQLQRELKSGIGGLSII